MDRDATAIVWFRRDLRLHDHPALNHAIGEYGRVVCLYVVDDRLVHGRWSAPNRAWFLRQSLLELSEAIASLGGRLLIHHGIPEEVVPAVARSSGARAVLVSRDYGPFGRRRDRRTAEALLRDGVAFGEMPGVLAVEPEQIINAEGRGFRVFGAFYRRWQAAGQRPPLAAPVRIPGAAEQPAMPVSGLAALGTSPPGAALLPAGESAARSRLKAWIEGGLDRYHERRDQLDCDGTSRLSQDLRWGLLSPVEVLGRLSGEGRPRFEQELAWREFYHHLAWHEPRVLREPFRREFARLPWSHDPAALAAWREGRTGFPVVDAAMRQLVGTGWMHNRARMIVASFLTKHLLVDYRDGERFFMEHLVDGDPAVNNGGWQWASSTGTDAQPYFRVFNPVRQGQRFDPDGSFVRTWIPELAGVPTSHVHDPWRMPRDLQDATGCVVGRDYPAPIVPPGEATARARAFFAMARRSEPT